MSAPENNRQANPEEIGPLPPASAAEVIIKPEGSASITTEAAEAATERVPLQPSENAITMDAPEPIKLTATTTAAPIEEKVEDKDNEDQRTLKKRKAETDAPPPTAKSEEEPEEEQTCTTSSSSSVSTTAAPPPETPVVDAASASIPAQKKLKMPSPPILVIKETQPLVSMDEEPPVEPVETGPQVGIVPAEPAVEYRSDVVVIHTSKSLEPLKIPELKDILRPLGLPLGGNRGELIGRILQPPVHAPPATGANITYEW